MARRKITHADKSVEEWDSEDRTYIYTDATGVEVENRLLTKEEEVFLDSNAVEQNTIESIVDELILAVLAMSGRGGGVLYDRIAALWTEGKIDKTGLDNAAKLGWITETELIQISGLTQIL